MTVEKRVELKTLPLLYCPVHMASEDEDGHLSSCKGDRKESVCVIIVWREGICVRVGVRGVSDMYVHTHMRCEE